MTTLRSVIVTSESNYHSEPASITKLAGFKKRREAREDAFLQGEGGPRFFLAAKGQKATAGEADEQSCKQRQVN